MNDNHHDDLTAVLWNCNRDPKKLPDHEAWFIQGVLDAFAGTHVPPPEWTLAYTAGHLAAARLGNPLA